MRIFRVFACDGVVVRIVCSPLFDCLLMCVCVFTPIFRLPIPSLPHPCPTQQSHPNSLTSATLTSRSTRPSGRPFSSPTFARWALCLRLPFPQLIGTRGCTRPACRRHVELLVGDERMGHSAQTNGPKQCIATFTFCPNNKNSQKQFRIPSVAKLFSQNQILILTFSILWLFMFRSLLLTSPHFSEWFIRAHTHRHLHSTHRWPMLRTRWLKSGRPN